MIARTVRSMALGAAVAAIPALAGAQVSGAERYGYGPPMMGWGGGWYGMFLGPLFMIVVIAGVVALVLAFARALGGTLHTYPPASGRSPLDILKERFARGEIDKQEYEERRRVLGE